MGYKVILLNDINPINKNSMKRVVILGFLTVLYVYSAAQTTLKQSYQNISSVIVEGLMCQVTIETTSSDITTAEGKINASNWNDEYQFDVSQSGSELKIVVKTPRKSTGKIDGNILLKVPKSTNLNIQTISGNISVSNAEGAQLLFKSVSGNVDLSAIKSNVKAESVSGDVILNQNAGNANLSAVSGNVKTSNINGSLIASSVSGMVIAKNISGVCKASSVSGELQIENADSNVNASTTSGGISLNNINGDISCNNTSGNIKLIQTIGSLSAKTVSGNISGSSVELTADSNFNTLSGDVTISFTNFRSLSFNLKSFSGKLNVNGTLAKDKLKVNQGSIWVNGDTFSSNQTYN